MSVIDVQDPVNTDEYDNPILIISNGKSSYSGTAGTNSHIWAISGGYTDVLCTIYCGYANYDDYYNGVRPVIEIPTNKIIWASLIFF